MKPSWFYIQQVLDPHINGQQSAINDNIMQALAMPDMLEVMRRQDVPPEYQFAAADIAHHDGMPDVKLPPYITKEMVGKARVIRLNQNFAAVTESEKRDMQRTLKQLQLDLAANSPLEQRDKDIAQAEEEMIRTLRLRPKSIVEGSLLEQFLSERDKAAAKSA